MREYAEDRWRPDEQVIAKFPSSECDGGWDLHIYPLGGRDPLRPGEWRWTIAAAVLTPLSRGNLVVNGPEAAAGVSIDHRFLGDPERSDLRRLVEAVVRIRETATEPRLARLLGEEVRPGAAVEGADAIAAAVEERRRPLLAPGRQLQDGAGIRSDGGRRRRAARPRDRGPVRRRRLDHADGDVREHEHALRGDRREDRPRAGGGS